MAIRVEDRENAYEYKTRKNTGRKTNTVHHRIYIGERPLHKTGKTNAHGDSFECSYEEKRALAHQKRVIRAWKNRAIGAITAATLILGAQAINNGVKPASTNFNASGHTIEEVAEWTDVDINAILFANGLTDAEETVDNIILPKAYQPLEDEISSVQMKLEKGGLSIEDEENYMKLLDELQEKQELQNELAAVYQIEGSEFVYIVPNGRVRVEEIKDAFGIKDGVVKKYNSGLSYTWEIDTSLDVHQGYKDYTNATTPSTGIKIPMSSLGKAE